VNFLPLSQRRHSGSAESRQSCRPAHRHAHHGKELARCLGAAASSNCRAIILLKGDSFRTTGMGSAAAFAATAFWRSLRNRLRLSCPGPADAQPWPQFAHGLDVLRLTFAHRPGSAWHSGTGENHAEKSPFREKGANKDDRKAAMMICFPSWSASKMYGMRYDSGPECCRRHFFFWKGAPFTFRTGLSGAGQTTLLS